MLSLPHLLHLGLFTCSKQAALQGPGRAQLAWHAAGLECVPRHEKQLVRELSAA